MKFNRSFLPVFSVFLALTIFACTGSTRELSKVGDSLTIENQGFRLIVALSDSAVFATLYDKTSQLTVADGPFVYRCDSAGHENIESLSQLSAPSISIKNEKLMIRGKLGALDLTHTFTLPRGGRTMEENFTFANHTDRLISLPDFEAGFTLSVKKGGGGVTEALENDRWVAIPFRERPDDPVEFAHDFSFMDLITTTGSEPHPNSRQWINPAPSRHRWSEAWAWTHEGFTLGIFSFCQEHMQFSVLSVVELAGDTH